MFLYFYLPVPSFSVRSVECKISLLLFESVDAYPVGMFHTAHNNAQVPHLSFFSILLRLLITVLNALPSLKLGWLIDFYLLYRCRNWKDPTFPYSQALLVWGSVQSGTRELGVSIPSGKSIDSSRSTFLYFLCLKHSRALFSVEVQLLAL